MSDYVKLAASASDQFLSSLAENQDTFLKSVTVFSSYVPAATPVAAVPFAAELPTPKEIVEANFAFATKLLKQQKDFTEKFLTATASSK